MEYLVGPFEANALNDSCTYCSCNGTVCSCNGYICSCKGTNICACNFKNECTCQGIRF